jgi:hypothetical protein
MALADRKFRIVSWRPAVDVIADTIPGLAVVTTPPLMRDSRED